MRLKKIRTENMQKLFNILSVTIIFLTNTYAQPDRVLKGEQIYKKIDGYELKVHIFHSEKMKRSRNNPAIAFFHGGGWVFGDPEEFFGACERYAAKGFVAFSFQYRLSIREDGTYPHPDITPVESVKDARSAIRWLRENSSTFHIDPGKIIVGGQSAGGQLALSTALIDKINEETDNPQTSPVPNAILLYSSCVNTMEAWIDMILDDRRDEIWSISPQHNLKKDMPPVLSFHGEDDCTVLMYTVRMFQDKMKALGNHYELITYPGRKHYLGEGNEKYATYFDEEIMERTDEFLIKFGLMDP
jgi:acetyl esterase/lipase